MLGIWGRLKRTANLALSSSPLSPRVPPGRRLWQFPPSRIRHACPPSLYAAARPRNAQDRGGEARGSFHSRPEVSFVCRRWRAGLE